VLSPDVDGGENPESKVIDLKIKANHNKANIFEPIEFGLYCEDGFTLFELRETYDSITWTVPELGRIHLFEYEEGNDWNSTTIKFGWTNNFFFPAKYETVLSCYKDDKLITSHTLMVDIENNKDFLGYNWDEVTTSSTISSGYHDAFGKYDFITDKNIENGIPSAVLYMWKTKDYCENSSLKERETFYSQMTSLYGKPQDSEKVKEIYTELFKNKPEQSEPKDIWLTPKSQIVLLEYIDDVYDFPQYKIQAEPRVL